MILYVTKQTFERYKLKMPEDMRFPMNEIVKATIAKESGNRLLEWGGKLFYFDRRKCIQFVNFASKLTLFLFDIKSGELPMVGEYIAHYLLDIYSNDKKMIKLLKRWFKEHPACCFSKLTDKSTIATLNRTQLSFADDGYRFYDFIENGILNTREINKKVNTDWIFTQKVNGKTEYFFAADRFKELLTQIDEK